MSKLASYLGITNEQLDQLDIEVHEDTGSSGDMIYSYWFEVPEDIPGEVKVSTGWKPGQIITGIPIEIIDDNKLIEESEFDQLLNEIFLLEASPYAELEKKINQYKELVLGHHNKNTGETLKSVLFGAAIGALEAYLWEIVRWKIDNDPNAAIQIITNCEQYGKKSFTLDEIVAEGFSIKKHLVMVLNHIVWHRIESIAPIFDKGLRVKLPSLKFFKEAIVTRHHIVHRSGKDTEGNVVQPTLEQVLDLLDNVLSFAGNIDKQLYKSTVSGAATNVFL
ncbi:MAG: hypothetical protein AB2761_03400 [Candidatus Thiodiazotropha endolucinida]